MPMAQNIEFKTVETHNESGQESLMEQVGHFILESLGLYRPPQPETPTQEKPKEPPEAVTPGQPLQAPTEAKPPATPEPSEKSDTPVELTPEEKTKKEQEDLALETTQINMNTTTLLILGF